MHILIVEDDTLMAELLATIVQSLYVGSTTHVASSLAEAAEARELHIPDLILCDLNLPDGHGMHFVRKAMTQDNAPPLVIISSNPDRASVREAGRLGVSGFISKPFDTKAVHERLRQILPPQEQAAETDTSSLETTLKDVESGHIRLPAHVDLDSLAELREQADTISVIDLEKRWRDATGLVVRLIDASNASALRRSGPPNATLRDALQVLGVATALDLATALALDLSASLQHPELQERAQRYREQCEQVASRATALARRLDADPGSCFTAALMHRLGELAILAAAHQHIHRGGHLDSGELDAALEGPWAGRLAVALKARLRLSLPLKQLIGAVYGFGLGSGHIHQAVMRAAFLIASGAAESDECQKLLRKLGLSAETSAGE